jgi:hypothetical protein
VEDPQVAAANAPATNVVNAINGNHADRDFTGLAHYDGTEVDPNGTELYISSPAPTDFTTAVTVLNQARSLYGSHLTYANSGSAPIFAHKVQDNTNVITAPAMDGATTYDTMFSAIKTLHLAIRTSYVNHINNKKPDQTTGAYHGGIDTVNVLGAVPVINDEADLAVDVNNLKAQYNLHIVMTSGSVHGGADMTNAITAPNAVQGNLDLFITLVNQAKTKINAHFALGAGTHDGAFGADNQNTIAAASVSYPAGLFDLINDLYTKYEAHIASTTFHFTADATNSLSGIITYPVTTLAALVSGAADIRTKFNAHFRFAPLYSRALRVI